MRAHRSPSRAAIALIRAGVASVGLLSVLPSTGLGRTARARPRLRPRRPSKQGTSPTPASAVVGEAPELAMPVNYFRLVPRVSLSTPAATNPIITRMATRAVRCQGFMSSSLRVILRKR